MKTFIKHCCRDGIAITTWYSLIVSMSPTLFNRTSLIVTYRYLNLRNTDQFISTIYQMGTLNLIMLKKKKKKYFRRAKADLIVISDLSTYTSLLVKININEPLNCTFDFFRAQTSIRLMRAIHSPCNQKLLLSKTTLGTGCGKVSKYMSI